MLSAQEISTLRSPDMWRVNRMTPGLGLLAIAVGTPVARCPPHRSGRALISVGPGRWSGQSGKELVFCQAISAS